MSNQTQPAPAVRYPRGQFLVKTDSMTWREVTSWVHGETEENRYASADTFSATFAANAMNAKSANLGVDWFTQQTNIQVRMYVACVPDPTPGSYTFGDSDLLIEGIVDEVEYDADQGMLHLTGRDKTAWLIDTITEVNFRSQTSSEIVKQFASGHGLGTGHIVDTQKKAGAYLEYHADLINAEKSQWDIICFLATQEGFVAYVKGNDLYFVPDVSANQTPYVLQWQPPANDRAFPMLNAKTLKLSRRLTIAKGIVVYVYAASRFQKQRVSATYPTKYTGTIKPGQSSSKMQVHQVRASMGTDKATCEKIAQSTYNNIVQHEMNLEAELPADTILTCAAPLQLQGTGTACDQVYFPVAIRRRIGVEYGYSMHVIAKNSNPNTNPA